MPFSPRPECYTTHTLTCWFHGFTYDWRDGKLVEILSEADSALIGKVGLKVYPTFEQHQVIFVWIGDSAPVDIHEDLAAAFLGRAPGDAPGRALQDQVQLACGC